MELVLEGISACVMLWSLVSPVTMHESKLGNLPPDVICFSSRQKLSSVHEQCA